MNWKNFFKPSWSKFSIFLIFLTLYLILILSLALVYAAVRTSLLGVCTYEVTSIYNDVVNNKSCNANEMNRSFTTYRENVINTENVMAQYIKIKDMQLFSISLGLRLPLFGTMSTLRQIGEGILLILYWYLLSCIIVGIYNKVKKK